MKIGIIVAIEINAIFNHYKDYKKLDCPKGYELYCIEKNQNEIYILRAGMGEVASSAGVQYLITGCGAEVIFNFGVVGGLKEEMKREKVCIVKRVVHYKYDCSEFMPLKIGQVDGHDSIFLNTDENMLKKVLKINPDLKSVTCCSGDKFVGTKEEKEEISKKFEGDICDMESAGIVLTCEANSVPCLLLKAVSDGLSEGADEFYIELEKASDKCFSVLDKIIDEIV